MFGTAIRSGRTAAAGLAAVAIVATTAGVSNASSGSGTSGCSPDLGAPTSTATKHRAATGSGTLTGIRVGRHAAYDRVVFDIDGTAPGWTVGYVTQVTQDPSGQPVWLRGNAAVRVVLQGAAAHTETGSSTLRTPATLTPEYPNLRQVRPAGDSEGVVTFGLGLRQKAGIRVFSLTNPTRIVVDVAH